MNDNSVAKRLQALILQSTYSAGQPLPGQRALALQLGVSRPALREGLQVLETLGLVEIRQAKGVYLTHPHGANNPNDPANRLRQIFEFRLAFEPFIASLASERRSANDVTDLAKMIELMRLALAQGNLIEALEADLAFHRRIITISGNPIFIGLFGQMANDMSFTVSYPLRRRTTLMEPIAEHHAILASIDKQSGTNASDAMRAHIICAAKRCDIDVGGKVVTS